MPLQGYSIAEVAERSGLSPRSVQDLPYLADFVRGQDYIVVRRLVKNRLGLVPRFKLVWTERGLARVTARNYRRFKQGASARLPDFALSPADHRPDWQAIAGIPSPQERRMVLRGFLARFADRYPESGGCALPSCRCICHELGVPRADLVALLNIWRKPR